MGDQQATRSASSRQVGGNHYSTSYQHWDLLPSIGFSAEYYIGCATKYITRHSKKNGRQDIEKACHFIEKLIELCNSGKIFDCREPDNNETGQAAAGSSVSDLIQRFLELNDLSGADTASEREAIRALLLPSSRVQDYTSALRLCERVLEEKYADNARTATDTEKNFVLEGYSGDATHWQCMRCGEHFTTRGNCLPQQQHRTCCSADDGAAPGAGYVDQCKD